MPSWVDCCPGGKEKLCFLDALEIKEGDVLNNLFRACLCPKENYHDRSTDSPFEDSFWMYPWECGHS